MTISPGPRISVICPRTWRVILVYATSGLYIKVSLNFHVCNDLTLMNEQIFESIFINIQFMNKEITCGTIYRSPQTNQEASTQFFNHLENTLKTLNKSKNRSFIMGDFNIDLLDVNNNNLETYVETMFDYNFYPLINKPTRIVKDKFSAIDHIWTNVTGAQIKSAILAHEIADHLPVIQVSDIGTPLLKSENREWNFCQPNLQKFCQMLEATDFGEVYNMSDPDDSFKVFLREINPMLVDCFKRKKSPKRNIQRCVWYNRELLLLSRKKDRLYKIYLKKKTSSAKEKYHKFRNFYFHTITQKKKKHVQNQFKKHQNNIRKTWQLMKNLLGKVRDKSSSTSISYEGAHVNKPVEIANCFNHHFSTIAKKLTDKLPLSASKFTDYSPPPNPSSMFMTPTNIVEIKRFICELKPKLSAGVDQIPPIVLRYLPDNVLHALTYIFNQSLCEGKFISVFKLAKIIAVYKKENPNNVLNYRPISLLSSVSKILEKNVYARLHSFINMDNNLSHQQFGFRNKHSTNHATTLLISNIVDAFEKKNW